MTYQNRHDDNGPNIAITLLMILAAIVLGALAFVLYSMMHVFYNSFP